MCLWRRTAVNPCAVQARRHFSADTRGKMDNTIRSAIIIHYGSTAAAADAPAGAQRPPGIALLGSPGSDFLEEELGGEAAAAPAAKGAQASSAAAAAARETRLDILRLQASAAASGQKYARASQVFKPAELQALKAGGGVGGEVGE